MVTSLSYMKGLTKLMKRPYFKNCCKNILPPINLWRGRGGRTAIFVGLLACKSPTAQVRILPAHCKCTKTANTINPHRQQNRVQ